ncbi:unnamed protein product [Musa hybrid cultivar]
MSFLGEENYYNSERRKWMPELHSGKRGIAARMGIVIDLSLPLIFFAILLGVGCYFLGRAKGRQDVLTGAGVQVYGAPVPPSGAVVSSPPPTYVKKEGPENI